MPLDSYDIIILRGAPGVGKSTLSKLMKKEFPEGITIEVDALRGMIHNVKWVDKKEHTTALNATVAMCKEYLKSGYRPMIIVDTLGASRMKSFVSSLNALKIGDSLVSHVTISLWCRWPDLENRIMARGDGFKDLNASRIINNEMGNPAFTPEIVIDTTGRKPVEIVKIVLQELESDE